MRTLSIGLFLVVVNCGGNEGDDFAPIPPRSTVGPGGSASGALPSDRNPELGGATGGGGQCKMLHRELGDLECYCQVFDRMETLLPKCEWKAMVAIEIYNITALADDGMSPPIEAAGDGLVCDDVDTVCIHINRGTSVHRSMCGEYTWGIDLYGVDDGRYEASGYSYILEMGGRSYLSPEPRTWTQVMIAEAERDPNNPTVGIEPFGPDCARIERAMTFGMHFVITKIKFRKGGIAYTSDFIARPLTGGNGQKFAGFIAGFLAEPPPP